MERPEDLSLFWLLIKLKNTDFLLSNPLNIIVDEGKKKAGSKISEKIFHSWPNKVTGKFASSKDEPLLQLSDFFAFCINRCTHLSMKKNRTEVDSWFLNLIGSMKINCDDLKMGKLAEDFSVKDFDDLHRKDRSKKGL